MIISQKLSNLDYAQFHINFMDNSVTVEIYTVIVLIKYI